MLRLKTILQYNYLYLILLISVIILSFIRINLNQKSCFTIKEKEFVGILTNKKIEGDLFSFELQSKEKLKCTYYMKTIEEKEFLNSLELGITLSLNGNLSIPLNNTIPNTFNYKKYLKQNKINYILNVEKLEVLNNKTSILYSIKNRIQKHISNYKSKDYINAFITGDKSLIDEDIKKDYQQLGVSHIFAISGMHISLLSSIILFVLKKLKVSENHSYVIVIIFLCFYMSITNYQASVLRSVGLFILLYFNKKYDFNIEVINILFLDIVVILLINPNFLSNIGFLYSSVVSFSLIKYSRLIKGNYLMKTLKVSLIAFAFSLPITLINNYEFNLLSVLNNLLIVPLVSLILYPLSVLSFFIKPIDDILLFIINMLESITPYLLTLKIVVPKVSIVVVIIYYIFLYLFFESYKKIFLTLILALLIIVKIQPVLDQNYYVYFLDVGQGDSIVIKKGSECLLIDTGGKVGFQKEEWKKRKEYYYTDNTIMFLHSIGVSKIDTVIITHGDADHAKEINHLLENIKVQNVIINKGELNYLEKSIPKNLLTKTYKGKLNLTILDTDVIYNNENDNSIVCLLSAYNYKFLFMGDASVKTETDLLKKYNISNVDVLKIGHHGSDTSSGKTFIDATAPRYAVISVGKNNRYGHPKKSVVDNLNKSKIYRTDIDGTINFKINNNGLLIKTYAN